LLTKAELAALGHKPMSPLKALRLRCLDCCNGSAHQVRTCASTDCPSWPFRLGKNPYRQVTEAQREKGRRLTDTRLKDNVSDVGEDAKTGQNEVVSLFRPRVL
jgi:hypothetical protein